MHLYFYLWPVVLFVAIGAVWYLVNRKKSGGKKNSVPEIRMGAIRVTGRDGRNMVIVRKDDGTFEMSEEVKAQKQ